MSISSVKLDSCRNWLNSSMLPCASVPVSTRELMLIVVRIKEFAVPSVSWSGGMLITTVLPQASMHGALKVVALAASVIT